MKKNNVLVGITIDKFKGIAPSTLLKIVKKMELEFVEITESVFDDLAEVKKVIGHIQTGFHLPNIHDNGYDFTCTQKEAKIQRLIKLINDHYQDLNINYCVTHPLERKNIKLSRDELIDYLLENLQKLTPPILIENIPTINPEDFDRFYEKAKKVLGDKLLGKCFDAPHYLLSGNDPVEYLAQRDGKIKCLHLSDCERDFDAHLPFGLGGELPVEDILWQLKKQNYQGFINLELMPRNFDDIRYLIDSYLLVLKNFNKFKYLKIRLKLLIFSPILNKIIKKVFYK